MKHKLISILVFFISFVVSFGIYAFNSRGKTADLEIALFSCLAFGALVAWAAERYRMSAK